MNTKELVKFAFKSEPRNLAIFNRLNKTVPDFEKAIEKLHTQKKQFLNFAFVVQSLSVLSVRGIEVVSK